MSKKLLLIALIFVATPVSLAQTIDVSTINQGDSEKYSETLASFDNSTRIVAEEWNGNILTVVVDSDIPQMASILDFGGVTGGDMQRVSASTQRLSAGYNNITVKTSPSPLGRGIFLSVGTAGIPVKKSGQFLPEPSRNHIVIGSATGGATALLIAFVWVRRKTTKTENSIRQVF